MNFHHLLSTLRLSAAAILFSAIFYPGTLAQAAILETSIAAAAPSLPTPAPQQFAWQQAELGMVFHYDLHVFDDKHYQQDRNRKVAVSDVNLFNPVQLDTDQWVKCAKDMGARLCRDVMEVKMATASEWTKIASGSCTG